MNKKMFMQWRKERDEMLEKRDVGSMIEFMEKWAIAGVYEVSVVVALKKANPIVQKATLCKSIAIAENVSAPTKKWAKEWLKEKGFSTKIR